MKKNIFIISTFLIFSCGENDKKETTVDLEKTSLSFNEPTLNTQEFINENLKYLESVKCKSNTPSKDCEYIDVNFNSVPTIPKGKDNQVVLIIDDGVEILSTVRYRNRVIQTYNVDADGNVIKSNPIYKIQKYFYNILRNIDNRHDFISSYHLEPLAKNLESEINEHRAKIIAHGDKPFKYILENSPNVKMVTLGGFEPLTMNKEIFCAKKFDFLKEKVTHTSTQILNDIIKKHHVSYINYSAGDSAPTIQKYWSNLCSGSLSDDDITKVVSALRPFYDVLFNTDNVLGFQAADVNMSEKRNPIDTDNSFKHRVRVSFYNAIDSKLDEYGRSDNGNEESMLDEPEKVSKPWIDMFINFGFVGERPFTFGKTPYLTSDALSLRAMPISYSHTSWTPPVAISKAIYIKNSLFPNTFLSNEEIERIKKELTPKLCPNQKDSICKIQDPIKHRQHDVFKLGYLTDK